MFTHDITFFGSGSLETLTIVVSFVGGTMLLVWMGELITERGIGNGISIIIFGGIVAGLPNLLSQGYLARDNQTGLLFLAMVGLILIFFIVVFNEAQRRIPVQYGRSVFRGGRMYRQTGATHLPLRVNSAGMIPLIFAFSIMVLPGTVAQFFANPSSDSFISRIALFVAATFSPASIWYWVVVFILVVVFTFFYNPHHLPTAAVGGEPAEERRLRSRHPPRRAHAAIPEPRDSSRHLGRRPVPRHGCGHAVHIQSAHGRTSAHPEQHELAHHGLCGARYDAPTRGAAVDAELRGLPALTARGARGE